MSAQLDGPCPQCGNTGPHNVLPDVPDPQLSYRVPVVCANCGLEFVIEVADSTDESA